MGYLEDIANRENRGSGGPIGQPGMPVASNPINAVSPPQDDVSGMGDLERLMGGYSSATPPAPRNAYPDQSLQTPRGAPRATAGTTPFESGYPDSAPAAAPAPGPISAAVGAGVPQVQPPATPIQDYGAQLRAYQAADAAALQEGHNQQRASNRAAQSSYDLDKAKWDAKVSNFFAKYGADMTLAPENNGYDEQRKAILADAANKNGIVNGLQGQLNANQNDAYGKSTPINDFVKTQEELNRGKVADRVGAVGAVENEGRRLDNDAKRQVATLRAQLAAETDPAKQKILQNKLLAIEGKQPQQDKVAIVDVLGPPDQFGQPTKLRQAINTQTGEMIGNGAGGGVDPVAALKAVPADVATKAAKAAVAAGAPLDEVNKRLKAAGHPELK